MSDHLQSSAFFEQLEELNTKSAVNNKQWSVRNNIPFAFKPTKVKQTRSDIEITFTYCNSIIEICMFVYVFVETMNK